MPVLTQLIEPVEASASVFPWLCQRVGKTTKFMPHRVPPGCMTESIGNMNPPAHRIAIVGLVLLTVREQAQTTHTGRAA